MAVKPLCVIKFSFVSVTLLTIILYGLVFHSVLDSDKTPDVPHDQAGLNVDQAFSDLYVITKRPHPVLSHGNDAVRAYLVSRLGSIVSQSEYVHLTEDVISNASFVGSRGNYYEGTNILVKVDGTVPWTRNDGVLFSAHFDSVSTGPGTTDDAMGIVTMLQLVEYFSRPEHRPRRTAVFLFNNGEEDGLNGSHMFFEHPWSNLVSEFINLEGSGSGGRPLVFRTSALGPVRSFMSSAVAHPHANVICADGYKNHLIRSGTDFEVFNKMKGARKGLNGVDFAFYQKRAVYHTPRDSIWEMGTEGARKSLWAMMDGARGAGISMLNDARPTNGDDPAVYFDILGRKLVVFPLRYLLFGNIALLVLAPASILVLLGMVAAITMTKKYEGAYPSPTTWWRIQAVLPASVGLGRFWIALLATTLGQAGLVLAYVQYNPFVIHSHANMVVIASLTLSYLASVVPLQFSQAYSPHPPNSQKLVILLELFFFTWILLVIATFAVVRYEAGGVYFVTPWYICTWAATISGLFEAAWSARDGADIGSRRFDVVADHGPHEKHADNILYDENLGTMNETTPLIRPLQISYNGRESVFNAAGGIKGVQTSVLKDAIVAENTWWIVQMLLLIPFPVLLMFELQTLLVHTLRNSPVDGNSPVPVYGGLSLFSILITINVAPFAHKLHRLLTVAMIVALFVTAIYTIAAAPFTVQSPLKVFFQQKVELVLPSAAHPQGYVFSARTFISAPNGTSEDRVVPQLPNSRGKNISCAIATTSRAGLQTCSWDSSDLLPSPGGDTPGNLELAPPSPMASSTATRATDWFDVNITRQGPYNATISVRGTNTRACRLQFTSSIITSYHVHGSPEHLQPGYDAPDYGINDLVLWSREWDNVFVVDIEWTGSTALQGSVGCAWAEYVSAAVGTEWAPKSARIPALEELFLFFRPEYSPIKWSSGLVEVAANFTVSS